MAPTSKSDHPSTRRTLERHHKSQSQDSPINPLGSPSSKSYSSGRTNGDKGNRRHRRRSSPTPKSALRETLSSFGDDVIKVKNYPRLHGYDNNGYFQPDIPFESSHYLGGTTESQEGSTENDDGHSHASASTAPSSAFAKGYGENELATILSVHDPNFQTKHFERVNPSDVGVRSSKWQKLFQASASSRKFQKFKRISKRAGRGTNDEWPTPSSDNQSYLEHFYNENGRIELSPPYWGVARPTRNKISILGLALILHELACFTSCVLLGTTLFQGMEAISWVQHKPFTENRIFFKWFSSFQTLLVVITSVGFLNRIDTTDRRNIWIMPLFLIPVLCLSVSDYCNKAWELQRLECVSYHRLDDLSKLKVHLSQDCSSILTALGNAEKSVNSTMIAQNIGMLPSATEKMAMTTPPPQPAMELDTRGIAPLVMRIVSAISTLIISTYLFCCRKNYFLIDLFGPPEELKGNAGLFMLNSNVKTFSGLDAGDAPMKSRRYNDGGGGEGVQVIFQRERNY